MKNVWMLLSIILVVNSSKGWQFINGTNKYINLSVAFPMMSKPKYSTVLGPSDIYSGPNVVACWEKLVASGDFKNSIEIKGFKCQSVLFTEENGELKSNVSD